MPSIYEMPKSRWHWQLNCYANIVFRYTVTLIHCVPVLVMLRFKQMSLFVTMYSFDWSNGKKNSFECHLHAYFPLTIWNVHNAHDTPLIVLPLPPRQPLASPPFVRPPCSPGSQLSRLLAPPMLFIGWRLLWCRCGWFSSKSQSRLAVLMLSLPRSCRLSLSLSLSLTASPCLSLCIVLPLSTSHLPLSPSCLQHRHNLLIPLAVAERRSILPHRLALPPASALLSLLLIPLASPFLSVTWSSPFYTRFHPPPPESRIPLPHSLFSFPFSPVSLSLALRLHHLHTL